jgi:hypothetical protein
MSCHVMARQAGMNGWVCGLECRFGWMDCIDEPASSVAAAGRCKSRGRWRQEKGKGREGKERFCICIFVFSTLLCIKYTFVTSMACPFCLVIHAHDRVA